MPNQGLARKTSANVGTTQSIQTADVDNKLKNIVGSSLATSAEEFTKVDDDYSTKTILVNPPSQVVETSPLGIWPSGASRPGKWVGSTGFGFDPSGFGSDGFGSKKRVVLNGYQNL